jgi:broad specificity phosphatase PhoE
MGDVVIVRHAESEANAGLSRHHDSGLSARGARQAAATGRHLRELVGDPRDWRGFVSPYLRTLQTAAKVLEASGVAFATDWRLREYAGPPVAGDAGAPREIAWRRADAASLAALLPPSPPSAPWREAPESRAELEQRVRAFLVDATRAHERIIVVSHGSPCLMLVALLRSPPAVYPGWQEQIPNASVTWVRDGAFVAEVATAHLEDA